MTKGVIDNKTKLIKMLYDGQDIPPNSHIIEIEQCQHCKGNVGWCIKKKKKNSKKRRKRD